MHYILGLLYACPGCGKQYKHQRSFRAHAKYECGMTPQFHCLHCPYRAHRKGNLKVHIEKHHRNETI